MSLTINTKTYTADSFKQDSVDYIGASKTVSIKDDVSLKRTRAKATSVFSGVGKSSAKLTRTHTLTGALTPTGDIIVEINVSAPVGIASADVDAALNDMGAYLASASFKTLVKSLQINY